MVKVTENPQHSIGWVDLATTDLEGARDFYGGLLGWTYFNDGETPYWMCMVDTSPVAGMMEMTPEMGEMPPVWSTYVVVDDVDATIAATTAAGGSVFQPPFDIPDGSRIAVIGDPTGAAICLFEGLADNGMKLRDEIGASCWYDCRSRDAAAAIEFYTTVFGWTAETIDMGMPYTVFSLDGERICGLMAMPDEVPAEVPSHWVVDFVVADADEAAAYAAANGATITVPPMDTPFGRSCGLLDPWGSPVMVIDRSTATDEPS